MNDHERFLLLAARRINEPLPRSHEDELEDHLATCPSCRAMAAGMRRDDIRLRAVLAPVPVAPRIRRLVLAEASGKRRSAAARQLILVLAASLGIAALGVPLIAGRPGESLPADTMTPSLASIPTPSPSEAPSPPLASAAPSVASSSPAASLPTWSVNASYTYSESEPKRGSISARSVDGVPQGAWSRRVPPTGDSKIWSGTVTCLVVEDDEAWMAGPVTVSPDRETGDAVFILVRDRGPEGTGDRAMMYLSNHGETLALFEGWCRERFRPSAPYPVTSGDVRIDAR